jgi:tetratricopeptide (TPR) repeat protein
MIAGWLAAALILILPAQVLADESEEKAYALNREGMIAMSEARFEEAIVLFQQAARLKSDYEISGKPLLYTPNFMSAWASEKIGDFRKACDFFRLYIQQSGSGAEQTKKEHAESFIKNTCH